MKRGLKLLAVLVLMGGAAMTADGLYAACSGEGHLGYPIVQCGNRTWFAPPPAGSGTVSYSWWQIGFGNATVNSGAGTNGTGFANTVFNGNDTGIITNSADLDVVDATQISGPLGSTCFSSATNWIAGGIDGCADNARDGATGTPYAYSRDDNALNKYFNGYGVGNASTAYLVDNPMAFLLKESSGRFFALAFLANLTRNQDASDPSEGSFQFASLVNGDMNLLGQPTVVPWQPVPSPTVSADFSIPGDNTSPRILTMTWPAVRIVDDASVRPSTDNSIFPDTANGGTNGVGVRDQGRLVRYVVQRADMDATGNCLGTWTTALATGSTTNATITVPQNTCVRLLSAFGRTPSGLAASATTARRGQLGDIGYEVTSTPVKVGGTLVSQKVSITSVKKAGGSLVVDFTSTTELNVSRFDVYGVDNRGKASLLGSTDCLSCTTGLGNGYSINVKGGSAKSVYVVMEPSGEKSEVVAVK